MLGAKSGIRGVTGNRNLFS